MGLPVGRSLSQSMSDAKTAVSVCAYAQIQGSSVGDKMEEVIAYSNMCISGPPGYSDELIVP